MSAALPFLAALALKATLVLALAAAAAALMGRASAAARHLVWCVAVAAVLALPALALLLPAWEVPLLRAPAAAAWTVSGDVPAALPGAADEVVSVETVAPSAGPAVRRAPDAAALALGLAGAGALAGLLWLALGFWGAARVGRRARVVREPEWLAAAHDAAEAVGLRRPVLLLRGEGPVMPATWGLLWPSVVLPAAADGWPAERRRAVLAHELAHVKRFDCLTQAVAQLACVLFWWHPGVWYAAKRLRVERERACDDLVLAAGARASDYAAHLLEVARTHRPPRLAAPALVSMAKPSHLESRLLWVLDAARDRRPPSAGTALLAALATLGVVVPLAAVRPAEARLPLLPPASAAHVPSAAEEDAEASPAPSAEADRHVAAPRPLSAPDPLPADTPRVERGGGDEVDRLVEMRAVGVTPEYVREMRAAGLGPLSSRELISMRAVGVTPAYVQELRARGLSGLDAETVTGMRAVGVTAAYVDQMRAVGFEGLSAAELTGMRAVGVSAAYVEELRRHGIDTRHAGVVKGLRAVGVTGAYVEEMRGLGLPGLDAETLTGMRALGVTAAYVRELASVGLTGLSARQLSELRAHGVTAAYVREMREAGFGPLSADQLVRLRVSGVDRELAPGRRRAP